MWCLGFGIRNLGIGIWGLGFGVGGWGFFMSEVPLYSQINVTDRPTFYGVYSRCLKRKLITLLWEGSRKATWKREFRLPWREAGPPYHHDDEGDSDKRVVNKELSRHLAQGGRSCRRLSFGEVARCLPTASIQRPVFN